MNNVIASRKFVWPAAALLIGLWLLPTIVRIVHGAVTSIATRPAHEAKQQEAQPQQQVTTQTAAQPVPDTKPSPAIPLSPEDQQLKTLVGLWTGQEVLADRGLCNLAFVLTEVPDKPGEYKGNTTGGCIYTPAALKLPTPKNPRELMSWAF